MYRYYIINDEAVRFSMDDDGMIDIHRYDSAQQKLVTDYTLIRWFTNVDMITPEITLKEFWDHISFCNSYANMINKLTQ